MVRGVLFDLDGVIVDTLHYHYLAWQHMFERYGGSVSKETILLNEGRKSREILPLLMQKSGIVIPENEQDQFIEDKRAFYRKIVRISHYPKSFEVVQMLKQRGLRVALVTASDIKNMEYALGPKQRACFDCILTGDEIKHAKPDPEPYLTAARKLGLEPKECIVVENAPLGIEAAKAAGMLCIAIESTLKRHHLNSADWIFKSIGELMNSTVFRQLVL